MLSFFFSLFVLVLTLLLLSLLFFPTPNNSIFFCNVGFSIFILMMLEFISGFLLSFCICGMNSGVEAKLEILNNSYFGWFLLKFHIIFPSVMAYLILLHAFKSLVFPVNSSFEVVATGFLLLVCFVLVSYTGYSLSGGSMGYWAIVVVNELLKSVLGSSVSSSVFFNYHFDSEVLLKVFGYHFFFSVIIIILQIIHIIFVHSSNSSNFLSNLHIGCFSFHVIMLSKDVVVFIFSVLIVLFYVSLGLLDVSGENFLEVNEFKPLDLSVEWYVSMFFMILSCVSFKFLGIVFTLVFLLVILVLFFLSNALSLESFSYPNFYLNIFFFNVVFVYMSYLGFSTYLFMVPLSLMSSLLHSLDYLFLKYYFYVFGS